MILYVDCDYATTAERISMKFDMIKIYTQATFCFGNMYGSCRIVIEIAGCG